MQYGVVEMGASHIGDIAELTAIAEPDFGLITNIGRAHLEGFGSFEGVTKAKCELYDWLGQHNREAWVNADDPLLMQHSALLVRTTYGTGQQAFSVPRCLIIPWAISSPLLSTGRERPTEYIRNS